MKIPNADFLERTGSQMLGARLWRLPPRSANTLHKHVRAEEFYYVLEGTGRMRVGRETLTVPCGGGAWVAPELLRQVFNDTDEAVLWLIIGAPEELEFLPGAVPPGDLSLIYPTAPTQLPPELAGVTWPPHEGTPAVDVAKPQPVNFTHFAAAWLAAWNAHDLEGILAHYAETVEFQSPFVAELTGRKDGVLHGRSALRAYFAHALERFPELHFTLERIYPGVRSGVLEYLSVNGLRAAEFMELNHAGTVCRARAHYTAA